MGLDMPIHAAIHHTLAAVADKMAHVRWNSHLSDANVEITDVTISNGHTNLSVPGDGFLDVSLPPKNGPGV